MSFISGAKGSTQTNKEIKLGTQQSLEQRLESVLQVAHQTVSGALGRAPLELATLGFYQGMLRYNSPDRPVFTGLSGEPTEQR
jgi:hypothetical protein